MSTSSSSTAMWVSVVTAWGCCFVQLLPAPLIVVTGIPRVLDPAVIERGHRVLRLDLTHFAIGRFTGNACRETGGGRILPTTGVRPPTVV